MEGFTAVEVATISHKDLVIGLTPLGHQRDSRCFNAPRLNFTFMSTYYSDISSSSRSDWPCNDNVSARVVVVSTTAFLETPLTHLLKRP